MTKYEARVKTRFGEIVVSSDSTDDLKKNIESLDVTAVSDAVSKKFESIIVKEPRQAKPGLESLYRFTPEGRVELLKTPSSGPMTIGLLLYASDPEPMSSDEMLSRGIKVGNYVSQTEYRKYFDKAPDNRHVLTQSGRQWVETEIIPKLRGQESAEVRASSKVS
jgi:hypothetical protein